MVRSSVFALVLGLALGACDKPKTEAPAPPPPPAPAPAPVPPPAPAAAQPTSGNMAHCPSTVTGAQTTIEDTATGVAITITGATDVVTSEIRARAAFLSSSAKSDAGVIAHNGTGEGGGVFGRCPIVMRNTSIDVAMVNGGAKVSVSPRDARERDWLRRESRSRLGEIGVPGAAGAGAGKMAHCPSAVSGATTLVADKSDAVQITVTAKADGAVKEIRDRARQIVLAAQKADGAHVKHDGSGNGGGGFGRCPIVLKDTSVAEKDAPGGALITVTPKNAKDLPALKQQVRDRTARFD